MSGIDELAAMQAPDALTAREMLDALWTLRPDRGVRGARMIGSGSSAAIEIDLANGEMMTFDSLRDMTRPANLVAEIAACAGVAVSLTQKKAVESVVLVRTLAERFAATTTNDAAIEWGVSYLQNATVLDVDMEDQRERWAAFSKLDVTQPAVEAAAAPGRESGFAASTIVLRSHSGVRYVRTSWFKSYVGKQDSSVSQHAVNTRMVRVGWEIRGRDGRIKATCPGRPGALSWAFLMVPAGWEDDQ